MKMSFTYSMLLYSGFPKRKTEFHLCHRRGIGNIINPASAAKTFILDVQTMQASFLQVRQSADRALGISFTSQSLGYRWNVTKIGKFKQVTAKSPLELIRYSYLSECPSEESPWSTA